MAFENVAHVMVADGDEARKPGIVQKIARSEKSTAIEVCEELPSSGLAQINFEIHQSMILFEGNDVGNIQVGVA